ncbi:hypothetical protein ACEPAF_3052 [Sanghuangporus sanghuang]
MVFDLAKNGVGADARSPAMALKLPSHCLQRILVRRPSLARHFHRSSIWAARKVVQPFKLADIGEGITECEVIRWNVKPSSEVQMFDPLCEVQSDKASVEITSPFEGIVKELLVKEGEVAKVGENLCLIEVVDERPEETEDTNSDKTGIDSQEERRNDSPIQDTSYVKEHVSSSAQAERQLHPLDPRSQNLTSQRKSDPASVLALPSVRHFAKERGVDLSLLAPGSGKGGRIEKRDVEQFLSRVSSHGASATQSPTDGEVIVELGRTRHTMWKAMVKSLEIPHFGYSTYLDLTALHSLIPVLNAYIPPHYLLDPTPERPMAVSPSAIHPAPAPPDVPPTGKYSRLTYLPFLLKTLSLAMHEWPLFRSSITPGSSSAEADSGSAKPTLTVRPHTDISIALSTPSGLYTPTIQRVSSHSVYSIASRLSHLSALGRLTPCGLGPQEMPRTGGTITVSNVGAIGNGEFASPVLVPGGGVAIVAIGRAKWVRDEEREGERRLKVGASWSADHRVVEGAELAAFVECWRGYVEHPERLIAHCV